MKPCSECTPPVVVGLAGATRSGKSSLAMALYQNYRCPEVPVQMDEFFNVEWCRENTWEIPDSIDIKAMLRDLEKARAGAHKPCGHCRYRPNLHGVDRMKRRRSSVPTPVADAADLPAPAMPILIVEGFLLLEFPQIMQQIHAKIFLEIPKQVCKRRRMATKVVLDEYFEQEVWPNYEKHTLSKIGEHSDILILNGEDDRSTLVSQAQALIDGILARTAAGLQRKNT